MKLLSLAKILGVGLTLTMLNCRPTTPIESQLSANVSQNSRLRITNECSYPLWIQQDFQHRSNDPVSVNILPNGFRDYNIPDEGLASTRFWAKANCNEHGYDCGIGESVGVPDALAAGKQTSRTIYDPDINSKFEGTFGCILKDDTKCALNPSDDKGGRLDHSTYWDATAVDGYTFAFKVIVKGDENMPFNCRDQATGAVLSDPSVDCAKLEPSLCPAEANISTPGLSSTVNGTSLLKVNLRYSAFTDSNSLIGCFSPCAKLTSNQWLGWSTKLGGLGPFSPAARLFCCPTKDGVEGSVSTEECRKGPAADMSFLHAVQDSDKGNCNAYAYAYDDAKGLIKCNAEAKYEMIFCPRGDGTKGHELPLAPKRQPLTLCNPTKAPPDRCPGKEGSPSVECPDCGASACPCPIPP